MMQNILSQRQEIITLIFHHLINCFSLSRQWLKAIVLRVDEEVL